MARKPRNNPSKSASRGMRQPPSRRSGIQPITRRFTGVLSGRGLPVMLVATEILLLSLSGMIVTIAVLGHAADWFGGTGLTESLLPFAGTVLILAISGSVLLWVWMRLRRRLGRSGPRGPAIAAAVIAVAAILFAARTEFQIDLRNLRTLVGGAEQAGRDSIEHQVFASYRRADLTQMQKILERSKPYLPAIRKAARANRVNEEVLVGIGATESSFVPRDSQDGGRGIFQITAPPRAAIEAVRKALHISQPDLQNPLHNASLAAATLRHYLDQMHGDLFMALLAYNIGPRNGGLRSIMQQYGARDFFTIQPYLQHLPRDYPIRVLTATLAFRLWQREGALPNYADGQNARAIQSIGIPGLDW